MRISHYILIVISILLLLGCGSDSNEGIVGEYQSAQAEAPDGDGLFEYAWTMAVQPDASALTENDLELSDDDQTMSFIPDNSGSYQFQVVVTDEFGDEVSTQSFAFDIVESGDIGDAGDESLAEDEYSDTVESMVEEEYQAEPDTDFTSYEEPVSAPAPAKTVYKPRPQPSRPVPGATIPKDQYRYTIQTSAKRTFEAAQKSAEMLMEAGFDSYIQKAYFKETDETWYRVRVGSFESYSAAVAVAANIKSLTKGDPWVDHVRLEN